MMDRESSEDDEDHHRLIHQNESANGRNHQNQPPNTTTGTIPRSTFHVEDIESQIRRTFKLHKGFLFAIFVTVFILAVFLYRDLPHSKLDSVSNRVQESELRALYLLRQQQLSLLSLWNRTFVDQSLNYTSVNSSSFDSSTLFENFKSAVLKQVSLNKEIQQVLLSPHRTGNWSENDYPMGSNDFEQCKKVDQKFSERKTIEWNPRPDKFLFAICLSGQMSNHLICLEKHMFFAAQLGRVLVIPSHKFDYQYDQVLDIEHINNCVGKKVVVSFDEFMEKKNNHPHIDRFICYVSLPQPCYVDEDHLKKLKGLGLSVAEKLEVPWVENIKTPTKRTVEDVAAKFKSDDDVIAIGDVFYADLEQGWVMQPGGPIAHKCKTLIEPSRLILLTAQRFVQTFLGKNFIALHFRRHGFLKFCNAKKPSCFYPVPQAADCITRLVEKANTPVIYLSTDAAESETDLLQSLIVLNGKTVPLIKRPVRDSAEKWDALLYRHHLEGDSQVEAMLDKTICALSSVFIGASGSTFTEDILRLRKDWGTATVCDEYLCQGEEPNFIAEDE